MQSLHQKYLTTLLVYNLENLTLELLGRKVMTNLDSILKSRDITLPTKVRLVKGMVFPMVMYECESWTIKKCGVAEDLQGDPTSPS